MGEPVLDVRSLTKRYGTRAPAVSDLSFSVEPGGICGFLGPNGAGKTTTLRTVLGIIPPDAGEVRLFGAPPSVTQLASVGFLPEERGLYRKMTPHAVITFFARLKGMPAHEARARASELLEETGLGASAHSKVKELSKGMAQKVQILAAIAHRPRLVILDEPFSGLDPVNQQALEALVRRLREEGATVLFSTHVMEHAERMCDRIVLLAKGRKVFDGSVSEALGVVPRQVLVAGPAGFDAPGVLGRLATALEADGEHDEPDARGPQGGAATRWRVSLRDEAGAQDVLRACVDAGIALGLFEPVRPHLHDAFVRLVQGAESGRAA